METYSIYVYRFEKDRDQLALAGVSIVPSIFLNT